jgi:hypothetical protein
MSQALGSENLAKLAFEEEMAMGRVQQLVDSLRASYLPDGGGNPTQCRLSGRNF